MSDEGGAAMTGPESEAHVHLPSATATACGWQFESMMISYDRAKVTCGDCLHYAPPPPATDPHEQQIEQIYGDKGAVERIVAVSHDGWTPLVEGCAMPEDGLAVEVTLKNGALSVARGELYWVAIGEFVAPTFRVRGYGDYNGSGTPVEGQRRLSLREERLTAWRPAPAPYSGGAK